MPDRETAIEAALGYLGEDAKGYWVESATRIPAAADTQMLEQLRNGLGRNPDDLETRIARQHNRDKWQVQFVCVKTERGETPQGPCVFVFEDGDISHFRPM